MRSVTWFCMLCLLRRVSADPEFQYIHYGYGTPECNNTAEPHRDPTTSDVTVWRCDSHMIIYYVSKNSTEAAFFRTMVLSDYLDLCLRKISSLNVTTYIPVRKVNMGEVLDALRTYPFLKSDQYETSLLVFELYKETYDAYHNNYKSLTTNITSLLPECFISQVVRFLTEVKENVDTEYGQLRFVYIYFSYIQLPLLIILFFTGILMDGLLIFLFIKFKEMRTEPNLIILNITICDLLTLCHLLALLAFLVKGPDHSLWYVIRVLEVVSPISTGASILALSVQRYRALQNHMKKSESIEISTPCRILLYLLALWGVPAVVLFLAFRVEIFHLPREIEATPPSNSEILHYTVLAINITFATAVPIVVTVLNIVTSRRLRRFAKNIPGEGNHSALERSRSKSSSIIIYLAVVFWVTVMPLYAIRTAYFLKGTPPSTHYCVESLLWDALDFLFYSLFYLNATVNPIALFIISNKYRQLLSSGLKGLKFWKRDVSSSGDA